MKAWRLRWALATAQRAQRRLDRLAPQDHRRAVGLSPAPPRAGLIERARANALVRALGSPQAAQTVAAVTAGAVVLLVVGVFLGALIAGPAAA